MTEVKELAKAWIKHAIELDAIDVAKEYECGWAWDEEFDFRYHDPEKLWHLIQEIHSLDQNKSVVEVLAAGPLEDLLSMHGEEYISKVECLARSDPSFAFLLGGVWRSSMSDEVWRRVCEVWDRGGWDGIQKES